MRVWIVIHARIAPRENHPPRIFGDFTVSGIKTDVQARRDFNHAAGHNQQQNQNSGRGAPDRITPEFNRAAAPAEQKETSRDQPAPALNLEPSQADLKQGGKYDLRCPDRLQNMQEQMQQQRSRNQDQSLGR